MKACPRCGFSHRDGDAVCARCGALIDGAQPIDPLAPADRPMVLLEPPPPHPLRNAWWRLRGWLGRRLWRIGGALHDEDAGRFGPAGQRAPRNPWLAGALAIVPGAGQLYNRQPRKAAALAGALGLLLVLAAATLHHPASNWILLAALLGVIYGFHDALVTAKRQAGDALALRHLLAFYCAWILYVSLFCSAAQYVLGIAFVQLRHAGHGELAPWLLQGERYALDRWSLLWRTPRLGEIVQVDNFGAHPRSLRLQLPNGEMLRVQPYNYIERVIGLPGDVFERRDGHFLRNGQPVPPTEQPLVQNYLPPTFRIQAPPGHYIILMSYTGGGYDPTLLAWGVSPAVQAPKMNQGSWFSTNFEQVGVVPVGEVSALPWFVYNPPADRRWLR